MFSLASFCFLVHDMTESYGKIKNRPYSLDVRLQTALYLFLYILVWRENFKKASRYVKHVVQLNLCWAKKKQQLDMCEAESTYCIYQSKLQVFVFRRALVSIDGPFKLSAILIRSYLVF